MFSAAGRAKGLWQRLQQECPAAGVPCTVAYSLVVHARVVLPCYICHAKQLDLQFARSRIRIMATTGKACKNNIMKMIQLSMLRLSRWMFFLRRIKAASHKIATRMS